LSKKNPKKFKKLYASQTVGYEPGACIIRSQVYLLVLGSKIVYINLK